MTPQRRHYRRWVFPAAAVTAILLSASSLEAGHTTLAQQLLVLFTMASGGVGVTLGIRMVARTLHRRWSSHDIPKQPPPSPPTVSTRARSPLLHVDVKPADYSVEAFPT